MGANGNTEIAVLPKINFQAVVAETRYVSSSAGIVKAKKPVSCIYFTTSDQFVQLWGEKNCTNIIFNDQHLQSNGINKRIIIVTKHGKMFLLHALRRVYTCIIYKLASCLAILKY